jgi:hypothetical protein
MSLRYTTADQSLRTRRSIKTQSIETKNIKRNTLCSLFNNKRGRGRSSSIRYPKIFIINMGLSDSLWPTHDWICFYFKILEEIGNETITSIIDISDIFALGCDRKDIFYTCFGFQQISIGLKSLLFWLSMMMVTRNKESCSYTSCPPLAYICDAYMHYIESSVPTQLHRSIPTNKVVYYLNTHTN